MRWVGHALQRADSDLSQVEVKQELALSSKPWIKCLLGDMKELNIKRIEALEDISKKRELFRIALNRNTYTQN
jgi:autonomous glycyl radical cofactor GrcA